jgi:dissimilatory sulfite reductase related protein
MGGFDHNGVHVELNEEGFLANPALWTEEMALVLAKHEEGLNELSDNHWAVIRFIRQHYLANQTAPMVRAICKTTGMTLRQVYELFPSGPAKGACKLAGLPKPDGCV